LQELAAEEQVLEAGQLGERAVQRVAVADQVADLLLQDLGVEQLLAVLPFIQRAAVVQALIALQADHDRALRDHRHEAGAVFGRAVQILIEAI
jgi:hypothetical protein